MNDRTKNPFTLGPWEAARTYHERETMRMVAKVMKACGVSQIDISDTTLMADDSIAVEHQPGFLRIKGHFELKDPT